MIGELCRREDELLEALERGFVGAELEEHAASCASCRELRTVAGAVLGDRRQAVIEAPIPSAGTMVLRMRLRHRQESEATARRSLFIGQAATLAVAIALVISFFGTNAAIEVRSLIATIRVSTPLLLTIATWSLVAPIAGWVAIRQK